MTELPVDPADPPVKSGRRRASPQLLLAVMSAVLSVVIAGVAIATTVRTSGRPLAATVTVAIPGSGSDPTATGTPASGRGGVPTPGTSATASASPTPPDQLRGIRLASISPTLGATLTSDLLLIDGRLVTSGILMTCADSNTVSYRMPPDVAVLTALLGVDDRQTAGTTLSVAVSVNGVPERRVSVLPGRPVEVTLPVSGGAAVAIRCHARDGRIGTLLAIGDAVIR